MQWKNFYSSTQTASISSTTDFPGYVEAKTSDEAAQYASGQRPFEGTRTYFCIPVESIEIVMLRKTVGYEPANIKGVEDRG